MITNNKDIKITKIDIKLNRNLHHAKSNQINQLSSSNQTKYFRSDLQFNSKVSFQEINNINPIEQLQSYPTGAKLIYMYTTTKIYK